MLKKWIPSSHVIATSSQKVIERVTQFSRQVFPFQYLGFPLYIGRCKLSYFGEVGQAILNRIMSWKTKFLSSGGKLTLIKHVLLPIPVHLLLAVVLPASRFKTVEKVWANFLWGASEEGMKYHWIGWSHLYYPVEEGGVGIRRIYDVYAAFLANYGGNLGLQPRSGQILCELNSLRIFTDVK